MDASPIELRLSDVLQVDDVQAHISKYVSTMLGYRRQSASDLARTLGMTPFQMSRRLMGSIKWTPTDVLALVDEFGVPVDDILAGVPEPPWKFA